jgi:hypothetical protein
MAEPDFLELVPLVHQRQSFGVESCQTTPRLQLSRKPLALRPLSNFNSLKVESLHPVALRRFSKPPPRRTVVTHLRNNRTAHSQKLVTRVSNGTCAHEAGALLHCYHPLGRQSRCPAGSNSRDGRCRVSDATEYLVKAVGILVPAGTRETSSQMLQLI